MVKKSDKICPFCDKKYIITVPIRARLRKYGTTNVKCRGCGEWFEIKDRPEDEKIDRRTRQYKDAL